MTTFNHVTVLLSESVAALNIKPDGIYVDCTLGGAGHSSLILSKLESGWLYAFDQDQDAIKHSTLKLASISDHFSIIHQNFKNIKSALNENGVNHVDGILYDLGVSSYQFDTPERGFSYRYDARLDMRMDQSQALDAYQVVNDYSFQQLVKIFDWYGDEKFAKPIARAIEKSRELKPIETTFELVEIIKSALPEAVKRKTGHPAKKVFQAIRIEVNQEFAVLEESLKDALSLLKMNGRLAVITFHSSEDRIVKEIFKEATYLPKELLKLPMIPESSLPKFKTVKVNYHVSEEEKAENKRSHSARLRVIERVLET